MASLFIGMRGVDVDMDEMVVVMVLFLFTIPNSAGSDNASVVLLRLLIEPRSSWLILMISDAQGADIKRGIV
jgi:hypothetical protein